jgi:tetratricopeptide (TPR) repeat protein
MRTSSIVGAILLALSWAAGPAASAEHPVMLMEGLGNHHHPTATQNAEAQKFFDQGLILTFAFNHAEAIRAFEKAHELDPSSPMPLWGKALALGPNYNIGIDPVSEKLAFDTITEASALAANAPEREKAYVEAMKVRYSGDANPDLNKLAQDYANAMRELSARYPDDLDAATLYAEARMNLNPWKLWTLDHQPGEGTLDIVADLEAVLAREPDHPGANHLYIHAVEASAHPEWAIPAAEKLETISKAAGHLVHMPSHIYMLVGDYRAAAAQNEIASDVDHSYIEQNQVKGVYPMLYYHHNLHFVASANAMLGRYAPAKDAADRLLKSVMVHAGDIAEMQGFVTEYFGPYPLLTAVRFNDWDAVLASPAPDASLPLSSGFHQYARGVALAAKGDLAGEEEARTALAKIRDTLPEGSAYGYSAGADVLGVALGVLDGRIATAKGDRKAAIGHFEAAVAIQDRLAYNEPADWYYPVRETLGAALFLDGQHAEAEEVFRDDLKKSRRSGRALFGLWQSLQAQGKSEDAELVRARYEKEWEGAEVKLALESY